MMEKRRLGKSDIEVSAITLGTWAYGRVARWGGKVNEKEVMEVIHKAVDLGINLINTAPAYGESEEIVGRAIKGVRERLYIATKCSSDPKSIPQEVDNSLKRLGIDYIDLYQIHYPSVEVPVADTIEAMRKIKEQGKIRNIGVSNFSVEQLREAMSATEITSCQSPYNLLWREIEETGVLEFCHQHDIGILTYSSLTQGLLIGKFKNRSALPTIKGETRTANVLFSQGVFEESLKVVEVVREMSTKYDKTPAEISLNWVISQPGVTSALMGARSISQLEDNIKATGWALSDKDIFLLSEKGKEISRLLDYTSNMWGFKYPR